MTVVSNDPVWWPTISFYREVSYYQVASFIVVLYDWALTFGQEFELVWMQRWSLMSVLYLSVRYIGIPFNVVGMLQFLPSVSLTDKGCTITNCVVDWMNVIVNAMLGVIMITRLHAMYRQSTGRMMLIFLIIIYVPIQITCVVLCAVELQSRNFYAEEFILYGANICTAVEYFNFLSQMTWILGTAWEVLGLCLAVWVAVKHLRELQRSPRWAVSDCFTILIKTHVSYFASFVSVSCLQLGYFSPQISGSGSVGIEIYTGVLSIASVVQMFVLGPRLILGVREYHAKLVASSDEGTDMASIVFQERTHITTGDGV